jgi:hypothetical protein
MVEIPSSARPLRHLSCALKLIAVSNRECSSGRHATEDFVSGFIALVMINNVISQYVADSEIDRSSFLCTDFFGDTQVQAME